MGENPVTKEEIKGLLKRCHNDSVDVVFSKVTNREYEHTKPRHGYRKAAYIHKSMTPAQCKEEIERAISECSGSIGRHFFDDLEVFYMSLRDEMIEKGGLL